MDKLFNNINKDNYTVIMPKNNFKYNISSSNNSDSNSNNLIKDYYIDKTNDRLKIEENLILPINSKHSKRNVTQDKNNKSDLNSKLMTTNYVADENNNIKKLIENIKNLNILENSKPNDKLSEDYCNIYTHTTPDLNESNKLRNELLSITDQLNSITNSEKIEEISNIAIDDSFTKYDMSNKELYLESVIKNIQEFSGNKNKNRQQKKSDDVFADIDVKLDRISKNIKKGNNINENNTNDLTPTESENKIKNKIKLLNFN